MTKDYSLHEYTLWLEPEGEAHDMLQKKIAELSKEMGTPLYKPHVTLLGDFGEDIEKIRENMKTLAQNQAPFKIAFSSIETNQDYYHSITLRCAENAELKKLNAKAQKLFLQSKKYAPHTSLLYGDVPEALKKKMLAKIISEPLSRYSFEACSISLWRAFGTADKWKKIVKIRFKKDNKFDKQYKSDF